ISEQLNGKQRSYQYDSINQLISIQDGDTEKAHYQYDPFGRRISKTVNGETTYYLYSDEGLIAELDQNGTMQVAYGWMPDTVWGTSPLWQASLDNNQTLKNADYHYLITDYLGTPQLAVNSRGQQTWKGIADAFGNTQLDPDNQITLNLRQPGQYYDQESGLYYNLARHYNPQTGRYIEADPLGVIGGLNLYGYANANPLKYADPYGLWSMDDTWGFIYDTTGWVPSQGLVDCLAGYWDYMSFGATEWLRDKTNVGGVDKCSDAYRYCTYIGMAQDAVTLGRAAFGFGRAVKIYRGYGKANKEFLNYVKNTKEKPAAVVVAVDKNTGKHALNTNGDIPEKVAPELKDMADKLGGLGTKTKCGNIVGRCAEFRAANDLMLQNPRLKAKDIDISGARRPRDRKHVERCDNCKSMFGPEL
ncbi:RHS repeat domain-containing protein, partial [Snodgrassella communis]|uniref:RHS repeat domain-containing protein n=1 Tax=Snodgrassella communis TaxID=2946699 RepID=UPI0023B27F05